MVTALSGCGFQPLYATRTSGSGENAGDALNSIDVAIIPNREGQILRNYLVRALNHEGRPISPEYRLNVSMRETISRLAIQDDSSATRANLIIVATYTLTPLGQSGSPATRGTTRVSTSYNILEDEFGTLSAERSARDRALRQTSLDIRSRLALALIKPEPAE